MNQITIPQKAKIDNLGLDVTQELSHQEWREIGINLGQGLKSFQFVVGDWLVYGEGLNTQKTLFPDIPTSNRVTVYEEASIITGIDKQTLQAYAWVSRNVPKNIRLQTLSWEHHKKVAKIKKVDEKVKWLQLVDSTTQAGDPVSSRRMARSIIAGELVSVDSLAATDKQQGIQNVHPYVNGIVIFIGKLKQNKWLDYATTEQKATLARDLLPIVDIYHELLEDIEDRD